MQKKKSTGKKTATKKSSSAKKQRTSQTKQKKILTVIIILILIALLIAGVYFGWIVIEKGENKGGNVGEGKTGTAVLKEGDLSIHFLELGNKYTGDCILIKYENTEVLIDAGSRQSSASQIKSYVDTYCTDGILEYVIATHAHQDHIAGFVSTKTVAGIFDSYECKTIIDFPLTDSTSSVYTNYCTARDAEVASGAKHYNALQCWKEEDGAKKNYSLGENVSFSILYNYYYEHRTGTIEEKDKKLNLDKTGGENEYSVCILLTQTVGEKKNNYLFTGDLEEAGEYYLTQYNTLPKVTLFKAGHHGSYTASSERLLQVIQPQVVGVTCCCGSDEYTSKEENKFPSQAFINRVAPYTDKVYVTTMIDESNGFTSMNGNIVVISDKEGNTTVNCSNSLKVLKDWDWFKEKRTSPQAWGN